MAFLQRRLYYTISHSSYYTILRIHILRTMSLKRPLQEDSCNRYRLVRPFQKKETTLSFFNGSEDIPAPSFTSLVRTREQHHLSHKPAQHQLPLSPAAPPSVSRPSQLWKTTASLVCVNCNMARSKCEKGVLCSRCEKMRLIYCYKRPEQDKFWVQPQCLPPATAAPSVFDPQLRLQYLPSASDPSSASSPQIQPKYLPLAADRLSISNPQLQPQYPPPAANPPSISNPQPQYPPPTTAPPSISNPQLQPQYPPPTTAPPPISKPQLQLQYLPSVAAPCQLSKTTVSRPCINCTTAKRFCDRETPCSRCKDMGLTCYQRPEQDKSQAVNPSQSREKRKVTSLACDGCRDAKAKCDEGMPQCSRCKTSGYTYTYSGQKYVLFKELSL
jgi:hypothetical protein